MTPVTDHERFETLLNKAVDGLLTPAERRELDAHLKTCATCSAELSDFSAIKETTDAMTARILRDAQIEPLRPSAPTRAVLSLGMLLLLASALLLIDYAGWAIATEPDMPMAIKLGLGLGGAGTLLLFLQVLRTRLRGLHHDPYREIDQ